MLDVGLYVEQTVVVEFLLEKSNWGIESDSEFLLLARFSININFKN